MSVPGPIYVPSKATIDQLHDVWIQNPNNEVAGKLDSVGTPVLTSIGQQNDAKNTHRVKIFTSPDTIVFHTHPVRTSDIPGFDHGDYLPSDSDLMLFQAKYPQVGPTHIIVHNSGLTIVTCHGLDFFETLKGEPELQISLSIYFKFAIMMYLDRNGTDFTLDLLKQYLYTVDSIKLHDFIIKLPPEYHTYLNTLAKKKWVVENGVGYLAKYPVMTDRMFTLEPIRYEE